MRTKSLFAEPWAMDEMRLSEFAQNVYARDRESTSNLDAIVIAGQSASKIIRNGSKATIPIKGVLMKSVPSWMKWWGVDATGYDDISKMVSSAAQDDSIKSIELSISSPGGQVAGILSAASDIKKASKIKPVTAVCQDLCASAAYWLASQANTIVADMNTEVGSIGVYAVIADYSKMAEDRGIKVHVVRSGEHKGAGVAGAPISDQQLEAFQEVIDGTAANFKRAVAAGRGMTVEEVEGVSQGRTWIASAALENKLIDKVIDPEPEEQVEGKKSDNKGDVMSTDQPKESPESSVDTEAIAAQAREDETKRLSSLQEAFPDDLAFVMEQFQSGASVEQAKAAMCDKMMEEKRNTPPPKPAEPAPAATTKGVRPIGAGNASTDDTGGDFMEEARAMVKANKGMKMTEAMRMVQTEQPELYEAFKSGCHQKTLKINPGKAASRV